MKDLDGKVAFITGGASGIGLGMARAFLRAGIRVVIADVSDANLEDAARQLQHEPGQHLLLELDVTDRAAFARAADRAQQQFGQVHLLCNNAGIGSGPSMLTATFEDWDRMIGINLMGVVNGVVTFLPRILAHGEGGYIVNTSSMAGILPMPEPGGIYTTTKFAVRGMTESLRMALAPKGVGAAVLCPGLTKTRILDRAREAMKQGKAATLSAGFVTHSSMQWIRCWSARRCSKASSAMTPTSCRTASSSTRCMRCTRRSRRRSAPICLVIPSARRSRRFAAACATPLRALAREI